MKQLLPWIKNAKALFADPQKQNQIFHRLCGMALAVLITTLMTLPVYSQNINIGGGTHGVGSTQDLILPNDPQIAAISFNLKGGDGGYARVHDVIYYPFPPFSSDVIFKSNGGGGASANAKFSVGAGPGEIPPGSVIRFVRGDAGQSGNSGGVAGNGFSYGGGGGGSAVLYDPPGPTGWTLLAVAGGGSGAYQGMAVYLEVDSEAGQGGRSGAGGGQGNGDIGPGSGGSGGSGGQGGNFAGISGVVGVSGAGGGANSAGGGVLCVGINSSLIAGEGGAGHSGVGYGGDSDGCNILTTWRNGGAGYGGGGAGGGALVLGGGGGGGGYSGGGAGGTTGRGGGGGSIVYSTATSQNITPGGTTGSPANGTLSYQVTLNQPPVAVCKAATIYLDAAGNATLAPNDIDGGSTDSDGTITNKSVSQTNFTCADVGSNTITLTVTDNNGATDDCQATVNVVDNIDPVAVCQGITVQLDVNGEVSITGYDIDNGSTDACGIFSYAANKRDFTCADVGANTVTLTVTDENGNTDDCQAIVTVEDNIDPVAICQDITIQLDAFGNASILATQIDNGSNDACGIASLSVFPNSFTCANVGANTVTLTVTDANGNESTCTATVTVEDNIAPTALCQNITVELGTNGTATITPDQLDNGSSDACGLDPTAPFSASKTDFDCGDVGGNEVTLTVTDVNGNTDDCQAIVTVVDHIAPDVVCQNITIQLDAFGNASIVATDIDDGSTDACGIETYEASKTDFNCSNLGNNTVTLTVTDVNGNPASCDATVLVEDNLIPIVRTRNVTVVLDNEGEAYVTVDMINNGSTDNCSIVDMWLEGLTEYDCGDAGEHEVVLKARDQSGDIGSFNAFVTVKFYEPDFKNIHNVANGDTIHRVDCQVPWDISRYDLDYETINQHGTITTHVYKEELPENAPWGMYAVWRYEYVVKDACYHTYKFNYYLALYDLAPPIYSCFPRDTTVATSADVPPVDMKVKIIDVCQYVVWDTVMTMPVLDQQSGDTLGYTRRWMARDPSGHESFNDQMIWLGSGDRDQYSMITGRIADEDHIANAKFAGEAGTNGLPVSLYRLDTVAGTRTWVNSWTTGDWMGAQGTYYFVPEHPGSYQVKIDTAICLVDTLKFNKWLWSDTLTVAAGESLDQGWIITYDCSETDSTITEEVEVPEALIGSDGIQSQIQSNTEWRVYPNPASGYLKIDINRDDAMNYQIYDALGRSVKTGVYQQGQTIDVHGLNAGLYHLQLRDQKEILGMKRVLLME